MTQSVTGSEEASDDTCQCVKCGRMHRRLGTPPPSVMQQIARDMREGVFPKKSERTRKEEAERTECPNCHNANKYSDYEGPTCEVCKGAGFRDVAQSIPGRALTASETSLIEKALRDSGEVVGVLEPVTPAQAAPKSALCADCIACGCKKDCTPRPPGIAYAPPEKAIEFLEWLIGFTGAVRTHPLNAYGNKILRDKLEQVGAELGIFSEPSSVPSTHQSPPVFKAAQSAESDPVVRPDCTGGDTAVPSTERSS